MIDRLKVHLKSALAYIVGFLLIMTMVVIVRAQIAPGSVVAPTFAPPTDVTVTEGQVPCTWTGVQCVRMGCDNDPDYTLSACINFRCENGHIVSLELGQMAQNWGPGAVPCLGTNW